MLSEVRNTFEQFSNSGLCSTGSSASFLCPKLNWALIIPRLFLLVLIQSLLLSLLVVPSVLADETQTLILSNEISELHVNEQIQFIRDAEQKITLKDILAGKYDDEFAYKLGQKNKAQLRINHYWFRFKLQRKAEEVLSKDWFLQFEETVLKIKKVYFIYPDGRIDALETENDRQLTHDLMVNRFTTHFSLEAGEDVLVVVNLLRASRMIGGIVIRSPESLVKSTSRQLLIQGVFYGGLLLMMIYNLFLFFSVRDRAYLYYSLYLFGMGAAYAHIGGFASLYIGEYQNLALASVIFTTMLIGLTCYVLFLNKFLNLSKKFNFIRRTLPFFLAYTALSIIYTLWQQNFFVIGILFRVFCLMLGVLTLVPLVRLSVSGHPIARVVLFATLLPISVLVLFVTNSLGITQFSAEFTSFFGRWALLTEFALLALALAGKFNFLQKVNVELRDQSIKNLKKSEDLKREFLSTISHELRTPMNGVRGSLELIRLENEPKKIKPYVKAVRTSADHMMGLIDSILDFITLDKGNIQMNSRVFDLVAVLNEQFSEAKESCQSKHLEFDVQIDADLGWVRSDPHRLAQVLKNLLSNAIKFTPSGNIYVGISREIKNQNFEGDESSRTIDDGNLTLPLDDLVVTVKDTGIGIEQHRIEEIFSVFKQGEGSFSRSHGGIGIGLTLTLRIVELLGGKLEVESQVGEGSQFTFRLPMEFICLDDKTEEPKIDNPSDFNRESDLAVLVVEDNMVNQKVLLGILKSLGETVHACNNGAEAVEWCKANRAKIIFMDCQMPVMDGFAAARAIRKLGDFYSQLPIIAVTANVTEGDRLKCREAGMDDFLSKPVKKLHIQNALSKWMGEDAA